MSTMCYKISENNLNERWWPICSLGIIQWDKLRKIHKKTIKRVIRLQIEGWVYI